MTLGERVGILVDSLGVSATILLRMFLQECEERNGGESFGGRAICWKHEK
jgi:hypothetical protein